MGICRPGDMGFDVMHVNLHKTFGTPHGGGGPGSGPVLCKSYLQKFLPLPHVDYDGMRYVIVDEGDDSIGRIATFFGNFGVYIKAYAYIKLCGKYGLRMVSENAVLNANYLKQCLREIVKIPFLQPCMHEFVIQFENIADVRVLDIAKRLLDYGIHAPTMYFPLIVKECMLIEPTETESKETLDDFVRVLTKIIEEARQHPQLVKTAPHNTYRGRLDDVKAAKDVILVGLEKTSTQV